MSRDDIIRMAREAGIPESETEGIFIANSDDLGRLIAAEREACAKVCEDIAKYYSTDIFPEDGTSIDCNSAKMGRVVTKNCAQSIRERGQS